MPNWMHNYLTIEGPRELLDYFKAVAAQPRVIDDTGALDPNPDGLSFWNFNSPPKNKYKEYFGTNGWSEGQRLGDSPYNWYNWNCEKWGVKWDASEVSISDNDTNLTYSFETPWGIPDGAFKAMSAQHPDLVFEVEYQEEQGWGGTIRYKKGKPRIIEEYSSPETHAEHELRNQTCVCEWNDDDPMNWYDDCPDKKEALLEKEKENE